MKRSVLRCQGGFQWNVSSLDAKLNYYLVLPAETSQRTRDTPPCVSALFDVFPVLLARFKALSYCGLVLFVPHVPRILAPFVLFLVFPPSNTEHQLSVTFLPCDRDFS